MREKMTLGFSRLSRNRLISLAILSLLLITPSHVKAGVVKGKVIALRGNVIEIDLGVEKGIQQGDSGKVYYNILVDGKEKPIFIAKFKITNLSEKSSMAQIEEKTVDVRIGYLVEITFKEGGLELKSEPSGAKVYIDGKEAGETPSLLSNIRVGLRVVRIGKEGYESYEEQVKVGEGERKKVSVSLKKIVGALLVNTDPPGATILIDGNPVGVSPYEGKVIPLGTHRVKITKEDYETWEREVVVEAGKGVEVFAALREKKKEVAAPSPKIKTEVPKVTQKFDFSKKSCEAPIWNIGDRWTYKRVTGDVWSHKVADSKENVFILDTPGTPGAPNIKAYAYDKKTLNMVFKIDKDGRRVESENEAFKNLYNFPLVVGKKWTYKTPWKNYYLQNDFQIEGIEEVETAAGKFMTYKIYYKQSVSSGSAAGWVRYWYSPEAKFWVKREFEKSTIWDSQSWAKDTELISYSLK
jgi:hypothetical protein